MNYCHHESKIHRIHFLCKQGQNKLKKLFKMHYIQNDEVIFQGINIFRKDTDNILIHWNFNKVPFIIIILEQNAQL